MQEYLAAKRQFREKFAERNPSHPHLGLIDADIAEHEVMIKLLDGQVKPVVTGPEAPIIPTAESITAHLRDVWTERGRRIHKTYDLPDLSATPDQIAEIYQGGRRISYVPRGITLVDLGRMFPDMRSWATSDGTTVRSDQSKGGYLAVEASVDAPNIGSDEETLRTLFKSLGRKGMTLPTYIVASQDAELETGQYFDGGATWSRLLGSRSGGSVVYAYFYPDGRLDVRSSLSPRNAHPDLGGRSQEAIGA